MTEGSKLERLTQTLWENWKENYVEKDYAMLPEYAGRQMFEYPLAAAVSAEDPWFLKMKEPQAVGPHYLLPEEWLPGARTVISFFFPFTEEVRNSNLKNPDHASSLWQHARIDGEIGLVAWKRRLIKMLQEEGFQAMMPSDDPRYKVTEPVTSNWSERHAAFIAGLGTFGISKGLITEKGMAGRYGSIITTAPFQDTGRAYSSVYEYCIFCGACARRCPVGAISPELPPDQAKDQQKCAAFLDILKKISEGGGDTRPPEDKTDYNAPLTRKYYGCGKCQVGVPCEHRRP